MLDDNAFVHANLLAQPFTAALLGDVLAHDFDTHRHLLNVGAMCARVGLAAGLSTDDALAVGQAGLFHDVGKTRVARALLNSRCALTEPEWFLMRAHPADGESMLRAHGADDLAAIVRGHHERLDGSGYPDGLRALAIPDATRLLAVVDAYDAMRAGRPYAAPISHAEALERLDAAHALFDPDAVRALVKSTRRAQATPVAS
jgi:HD-GYP domain-containing protein (c-di-GMP phosphodiesterase class II)